MQIMIKMEEKKKVVLFSNVTTDLLIAKLKNKYDFYKPNGFDTWIIDVFNQNSYVYSDEVDAVFILLDGTESREWRNDIVAKDRLDTWIKAIAFLAEHISNIPIFITNIDFRENRIRAFNENNISDIKQFWYSSINTLLREYTDCYLFDLADIIADVGRKNFYSNKMWYLSNSPYSREGIGVIAKEIDRALSSAFSARKKIIALDLDNTLWGGVVGEDGFDGIQLSNHKEGQRFYDFQRQLLEMKSRGTVLAICSKNNVDDAENVIKNHPMMLLHDDDFVSKKINWNSKDKSISELICELNISEGGFIFIDDNPAEREAVHFAHNDVSVPDFPSDTSELISFAEEIWLDYLRPLKVVDEDRTKTEMYQSESLRKREAKKAASVEDYISRLEIVVDIHRMLPDEVERVTQLCNKTNQFNLTSKRYTSSDINKLVFSDIHDVFVVKTIDKYGDNGLISVIILEHRGAEVYIDTFLMSCRVMGRNIEKAIIDRIVKYSDKDETFIGEYIPSAKNAPVKDLYSDLGFELFETTDEHKLYRFVVNDYVEPDLSYFKTITFKA